MEEAEPRFDEVLEVMIKAWTSDTPWSHRGQYWQFDNIVVEPPTVQKPHPPIWMGAGSPGSIKKVAANGFNLLLGQFSSLAQIAEQIALFKSEVEASGRTFDPMTVGVARSLNVVMNREEYEKAIENRMAGRRRVERLSQRPDAQNQKKVMSEDEVREVAEAGTLYGTPDDIAVKLQALRDVGAAYVLINSAGGPASLRRFAREVMPAFAG
jgi:alkanesulfonate monooxygenase SsuD/methylene tetrahydromethanopterin reductase-like flavin-dependent oxidoreductase (luciferase family)